MRTITDKIEGDLLVTGEIDLRGMVTGTITVASGARLNLYGMACGDIVLNPESKIIVYGMINGNLISHNGDFLIEGVVRGDVIRLDRDVVMPSE